MVCSNTTLRVLVSHATVKGLKSTVQASIAAACQRAIGLSVLHATVPEEILPTYVQNAVELAGLLVGNPRPFGTRTDHMRFGVARDLVRQAYDQHAQKLETRSMGPAA